MKGLALAALIATPALAGSQRLTDTVRLPDFEGGRAVVRVHVVEQPPYEGSDITIYAAPPGAVGADPVDQPLSAIAVNTRTGSHVARSATCPGLRTALQTLRLIPPIDVTPRDLRPPPAILLPIEPTKKDGSRFEISIDVETPNGSGALLTIDDYSGDHAVWAETLMRSLASCWTELR
ncbi:hypothetical protein [Brevundimonas sp. NIBR11]|uniref:hypothetical protein n=1 Tax=Brevundimonas sp. NIBR11 TaxID=3015999 RepID=UPI0022F1281B|nr:hypothetical protein [Brevundimonas sp. NIBR11]WGM32165.1 hypothetical protein KKHFBJBL_02416 [Brevundimonas sp. NIBR11]